MHVPHGVLAGGWIPFTVVVVVTFVFCWIYVRLFQHHSYSEVSSTVVSIFALFVTLLTSAVIPVDVFLVSFMKHPNGTFKHWAMENSTRDSIESAVTYTYYTLYGFVALFIFVVLPFAYFFYEEKDDEEDVPTNRRCCNALKYSFVFFLIAIAILLTGAFVPLKMPPKNMTSFDDEFNFLKHQLEVYTKPEQAMSIMVGILSMIGMLTMIMYTAYGMSALPLGMIKCCRSYNFTEEETAKRLTRKEKDDENARILRAKVRSGRNLSRYERNELRRIEQDERLHHKIERKKEKMRRSCCGKFLLLLKPFEVIFGIFFMALSLLLAVSLTITSVDKLQHSAGAKYGYSLPHPTYPNPANIVMVFTQKIFPLDYVLFSLVSLYFIFASMNGIKRMGIWCCCIKMFKVRVRRTMPQGLLFMVFIMMFTVIALNIIIFTISPQYVQYGNQQYTATVSNSTKQLKPCSTKAPEGMCVMSRIATILNMLFYKAWFFGAYYYWATWVFIGVYFLGLLVGICRAVYCRKTEKDLLDSDDESDLEEDSDTERLIVA